jgi:thiol-disulfide isomerase/thioredoxin
MKALLLCAYIAICAQFAYAQAEPTVMVDNISVLREQKGWRVIDSSTAPVYFNPVRGDLIVRIDGRNAAETGPMQMASLLNQGNRRAVNVFIERGTAHMEMELRKIRGDDYEPVGENPFRRVASGSSAPNVKFKDIDGQPLEIGQFQSLDKWLLIDFMATWCAPCVESLPQVLSVSDHAQLNLLLVAINDKRDTVRRMQKAYNITSPIAMMQTTSELPISFGVTTNNWWGQVPGLVLIRPDGEVALIAIGALDSSRIEKMIEPAMTRKADEPSK